MKQRANVKSSLSGTPCGCVTLRTHENQGGDPSGALSLREPYLLSVYELRFEPWGLGA
jgi:hypothetical protein